MFQETNEKLRKYLLKFIPILDEHHEYAKNKWLKQEMSKAAYEHIYQRNFVANILNQRMDIEDEQLVNICSEITIDIHSAVDLLNKEEQEYYNILVQDWYECFKKIGYTDIHPVFKKPEKNLTHFEDFEKRHKK